MHALVTTGSLALACFAILYLARRARRSEPPYPLPPGPPGLPGIGCVMDVDEAAPWSTYANWAKTYGDLVHAPMMGRDIFIINSEKIAKDLLENRSRNYSGRPHSMVAHLCGIGFNSVFIPYGDRWRLHRRFFHQTFRLEAASRFLPYQHRASCHLLQRLLEVPANFDDHTLEYTSSIILNSTYNYDPLSRKDDLVDMVLNVLTAVVPVLRPEIDAILNAFPWLVYCPSWLPGMSFKKEMAAANVYSKQYLDRSFEYSLHETNNSVAPSMIRDALQHSEEQGTLPKLKDPWMQALKEAAGTAILGGIGTSGALLSVFFLLMVMNPAAQERAQAQIDDVVGRDRLPGVDDRPSLPYLDAIFRETVRYNPVAPLSIPHVALEDDMYSGFHIPKGAIFLANLWSMAHDESKYPSPYAFVPERFLNDDGSLKSDDTKHLNFGFGRRMCVGRHFADASVWVVIAKVLAVFKILKPLDENGVEIPVEPKFSNGVTSRPLPFRCRIVPRVDGMDAEQLARLIAASSP